MYFLQWKIRHVMQPDVIEGVFQNYLFAFDFPYGIDGNESQTADFPRIFFYHKHNYFCRYLKKG